MSKKKLKAIPEKFKILGSEISVVFDENACINQEAYGIYNHSERKITLSKNDTRYNFSEDAILDTFYHEAIHAILYSVGERELSENEKFVDLIGKAVRQMLETSEGVATDEN